MPEAFWTSLGICHAEKTVIWPQRGRGICSSLARFLKETCPFSQLSRPAITAHRELDDMAVPPLAPGAALPPSEWMRVEGSGCPQDFTGLRKGALLAWIKGDAGSYMGVGLGHACRHEYTCTQTQTHIHTRAFSLLGVLKCQSEAADLSCQYPGDNSHLLDTRMNYCQLLPCAPQPGGPCLSRPQYSWPFHRPLWVSPKPPSPQVEHIKQSLVRGRGGGNLSHTNIQDFPRWQWKFLTESKVPITRRKCSQCSKFFKKQFPKQYYNPIFLNIPTSVISYVSLELQSPGWSSSLHPH